MSIRNVEPAHEQDDQSKGIDPMPEPRRESVALFQGRFLISVNGMLAAIDNDARLNSRTGTVRPDQAKRAPSGTSPGVPNTIRPS